MKNIELNKINSKFYKQLQIQERMLENGQNMSYKHIEVLKNSKE